MDGLTWVNLSFNDFTVNLFLTPRKDKSFEEIFAALSRATRHVIKTCGLGLVFVDAFYINFF